MVADQAMSLKQGGNVWEMKQISLNVQEIIVQVAVETILPLEWPALVCHNDSFMLLYS